MSLTPLTSRVRVLGAPDERHDEILTPAALEFVGRLDAAFADRRLEILKERRRRSAHLVSGSPLDFSRATSAVRADPDWRVAPSRRASPTAGSRSPGRPSAAWRSTR